MKLPTTMRADNSDETIDSATAAVLCHCSVDELTRRTRAGDLPALPIGRGYLYLRAQLLERLAALAEEHRTRAQELASLRASDRIAAIGAAAAQPTPPRNGRKPHPRLPAPPGNFPPRP